MPSTEYSSMAATNILHILRVVTFTVVMSNLPSLHMQNVKRTIFYLLMEKIS